ncbi:MBL fold metallo-hydrolase [Candidatus Venteria ishoeyi]|uniref:MBL fold metallo-hydrolase n=1 Tax=Candidatus Venteria ishoeyi TaxID=1899563 RepID=UPI0025A5046A|nr:MBL fold metallo-hydrolase [Candidatus Venteria ishoeyi]MDM8546276.1 MBL fold metallo-hydrolase [Candidatus Venteria ishoeyi]
MTLPDHYLRFWGVRGSYPAPFASHLKVGGNTSCIEIFSDGHLLICDGGTGIIPLGNMLMGQSEIREVTILLTHYHWDHISGLPFFVPAFVPGWKVNFFGPGDCPAEIEQRISGQMQSPYFPVEVETWLADIKYLPTHQESFQQGPFKIRHFNVHHPGTTFGYHIEFAGKSLVYISDNELAFIDHNIRMRAEELEEEEHRLILAMQEEERENALKDINQADIFIHDAQYTKEDYAKKRGWGHSCYLETTQFAIDAKVGDLYLFHVDPNYDDNKIDLLHQDVLKVVDEAQSPLRCHIAREGKIIDLSK